MTRPDDLRMSVRAARADDQAFVASTMQRQLLHGTSDTVNRVLDHPTTRVLVACEPLGDTVILGWLCFALVPAVRLVHMCYVRKPLRRRGVARALGATAWPANPGGYVYTLEAEATRDLAKHLRAVRLPLDEALAHA